MVDFDRWCAGMSYAKLEGVAFTVTRRCGISGWMCDIAVTSLTVLVFWKYFRRNFKSACHRKRQYWFWDRLLLRLFWCLFYLHHLSYHNAQVEIFEYLPTLKPWNLLKSGWVMKNLLPNLVHGILRCPISRLCPWYDVGRLPNRNGSRKNSCTSGFSLCAVLK